jgi:phosphoglycolate phosphatase
LATISCQGNLFEQIQAIVFDKDGTLANSEFFLRSLAQRRSRLIDAQIPGVQEPLLMAFGVEGDRLNPTGLMAVGSRLENEIAAAAYVAETGRGWVDALEIVRSAFTEADKYVSKKAEQTPPIAGVTEFLKSLSNYDLKLGILSSDTTNHVRDFVENYGLKSYFHSLFGVDEHPNKFAPQLLQQLFFELGVPPNQTLMIGDSQMDIQIADLAGMAGCIAMTGGWTTPLRLSGAKVTINSFHEVQLSKDG